MISLTKEQINEALPKVKKGLDQYLWIQSELMKKDVSKDVEFQKKFNYFYKITPHRNKEWQKEFYSLLQKSKKDTVTFESILSKLFKKTGKVESSFASKLVATIDPKMPVIDSIVLKNLKLKLPYSYDKERESKIIKIYQTLIKEFSLFLKTESGKYLVEQFTKEYPTSKISKTKMLDLILWQTRN
jgi:hypothetical protein